MLYVQDRMNQTLGVIDNYYNDTHSMILESGVSTYKFTIPKNQDGSEYLVRGNYVVLADDKGQGWKFTIMSTDETHDSLDVECEDLGLELLNKVRNSWASPGGAQPFKYYFDKAVRDTGWTLGVNEISNLNRTLSWDGRDTALKRLLSICTQFDHAEIEFKVEFRNMAVVKQIVNVYKQRGADRSDTQLIYGDSVNDIRKTTEIRELATAIQGVGGVIQKDNPVEEEPEEHVDFASLTYDDGEYFTPAGDPFLYARVANQQFNIKDTYLEDFYDYETQDAQELLNRTLTQLKERCQPKVNYEVDLAKVDSSLNLGDTVTIIDHDYKPELLLSGRVLQLDKSYTDPSKNEATFGNFLIIYSNISDQLRALQEQMNSLKPVANYMWLRYAKDDKGNGMTAMPTSDTKYFAMLVNKKTGVPSDDPADYAGHWQLIKGNDGKDGIPGTTGADGKTSYTHFAYANNVSGTADFSTDDPSGRSYMGVYSDFTKADSNNPSDYVWSLTKGRDGLDGAQGIPGKPGADGKTSYTHIAYADNDKGGGFSQSPANKAYMGWYTDFTQADSTDPTKYAWSLIKGADGTNGAPGKPGVDGKTPYFHQAWADSKDGKVNFSTTDPTNRGYLGTYSDFTQADSTDPTKYFWVELVGAFEVGGINLIVRKDELVNRMIGPAGDIAEYAGSSVTKNIISVEPGNALTMTRYNSTADNNFRFVFYDASGAVVKRDYNADMSHTEEVPPKAATFRISYGTNLIVKLERGRKSSEYTPAPEDTQQQIDSINQGLRDTNSKIAAVTKVDAQATAPTNPKKGDQWWVKDANGEINAFKIWDGTKWADSIIQQSAMNISTLNGNIINGATINGSEFTNSFNFTGADNIHFQGVTKIENGSVSITWKIPENNQTGETKIDASGLMSVIRDIDGTALHRASLQMGQLLLSDLLSGSGSSANFLTGTLDAQDAYRNSTDTVAWLGGWGDWGNGSGLIHVVRNGRLVTLSGYPHHNNTTTLGNIFQLPAWAKPAAGVNISAICYNSSVVNPTACKLFINNDGLVNISNAQKGGYVVIGASYVGQDM